MKKSVIFVALTGLVMMCVQPMVSAHQSPPGCNSSSLDLSISKDKTIVRPGEVITYSVFVVNLDSGPSVACDITSATTKVTLPAADGTPTGNVVTLASGVDYPAGTPSTFLGDVSYTVNVNPGVSDVIAEANIVGTLHDAPVNHSAQITKTVGTQVTQPHATLTKAPNPASGRANLVVTYNYTLTNDSSTNAPLSNVSLTDDSCSPVTYTGGDSNGNNLLDVGEVWSFMCQKTHSVVGDFTNTVIAAGVNTADGRAVDIAPATATVRVTSRLPGLPKAGLRGDVDIFWLFTGGHTRQVFAASH